MFQQLIGFVRSVLQRRLGVHFMKSANFQRLLDQRAVLEVRLATLDNEIAALHEGRSLIQQENDELHAENEKVRKSHDKIEREKELLLVSDRIQKVRIDWLNAAFQKALWRQQQLISDFMEEVGRNRFSLQIAPDDSEPTKQTVIVMMTSVSQITQLAALAASGSVRDKYELIVVGFTEIRADLIALCRRTGITLLTHNLKPIVGSFAALTELENQSELQVLPEASDCERERVLIQDIAAIVRETRYQLSLSRDARRLLKKSGASLLVAFEDNAEHVTGIWIAIAQELLLPSVILPYTIVDYMEPAETHYDNPAHWADSSIYNRLVKAIAPQWLLFYRGRWLLRRPGIAALAAESLDTAPPMPWILNSSRANAIAVESEAMRQHYLAQGIPEPQLAMTGSLTDDLLHEADQKRDILRKELGLDSRPVLLCSFPPDQLTATRHKCEFPDFRAIADFWLAELKKIDWQVLVKPHPSVRAEDIDYLRLHGLRVVTEPYTTTLLPVCDLYNPSVSSTIRWALACGKPVLNYDVYRFGYQDFVSEPAVRTVFDAADFSAELQRLTSEPEALRYYSEQAKAAASRWGIIDGQSMDRIARLFKTLTERRDRSAYNS